MPTLFQKASDVRDHWSETIDVVSRKKPVFVKRTHDNVIMTNMNHMQMLVAPFEFRATMYAEDDGSITLSMNNIDIIENAATLSEAKHSLALSMYEYATEYYEEFELWSTAPNRQSHIPYIIKALLLGVDEMEKTIICQNGQN